MREKIQRLKVQAGSIEFDPRSIGRDQSATKTSAGIQVAHQIEPSGGQSGGDGGDPVVWFWPEGSEDFLRSRCFINAKRNTNAAPPSPRSTPGRSPNLLFPRRKNVGELMKRSQQ